MIIVVKQILIVLGTTHAVAKNIANLGLCAYKDLNIRVTHVIIITNVFHDAVKMKSVWIIKNATSNVPLIKNALILHQTVKNNNNLVAV